MSIPDQLDRLRAFCNEHGWPIVGVYKDEGISGGKTVARRDFMRMVNAGLLPEPPFDLILTRDAARFGRGDEDNPIRARLRKNGVHVDNMQSPTGDMFGDMTPEQKYSERLTSAADILQREQVPARVIASQRRKVSETGTTGSIGTMFGFEQVYVGTPPHLTRTVELHKRNAKIVREMFERCARGDSVRSIRNWLNGLGISSPRNGAAWGDKTVKRILTNETATGVGVYGRLETTTNPETEKAKIIKSVTEPVRKEGAFPAIVSRELFDTVQNQLANKVAPKPGEGNPLNLVRGLIYCEQCGWALAFQRREPHWYYLCSNKKMFGAKAHPKCSNTLRKEYVDSKVVSEVRQLVENPDYVTRLSFEIQHYNDAAKEHQGVDEIAVMTDQIAELERKSKNLIKAIENNPLPQLVQRLRETGESIAAARDRRDKLASALRAIEPLDNKRVVKAAKSARSAVRRNDFEALRELLPVLFYRIDADLSIRPPGSKTKPRVRKHTFNEMSKRYDPLEFIYPYDLENLRRISLAALERFFER